MRELRPHHEQHQRQRRGPALRAALCLLALLLLLTALPSALPAATPPPDIIPMPKRLGEPQGAFPLSGRCAVVIAGQATAKERIGAAEINSRLSELGAQPLPVKSEAELAGLEGWRLVVVGVLGQEWLKRFPAAQAALSEQAALGPQGYVITFDLARGQALLLGGGAQGALWACETFRALLAQGPQGVSATAQKIWDKPDFTWRMADDVRSQYESRPEQWPVVVDFALRHKLNAVWARLHWDDPALQRDPAWFRRLDDYAAERGIAVIYQGWWDVGQAPIPPGANFYGYRLGSLVGSRGKLFTWADDQLLARKAQQLAAFVRSVHPGGLFLHCIDAGGAKDPEQWSRRGALEQQRFGDDRAAADANVINTLYRAVKGVDPACLFIAVVQPYKANNLGEPGIRPWLARLTKLIPPDCFLCLRERGDPQAFAAWRQVARQPVFLYHESEPRDWELNRPGISSFRFARTFYEPSRDDLYWFTVGGALDAVKVLGAAEFAWNSAAPGSETLQDCLVPPLWRQAAATPAPIAEEFWPRACRVLFGPAAPEMAAVIRLNLSAGLFAFAPDWVTQEDCRQQMEAAKGALAVLAAARPKVPPGALHLFGAQLANATGCRWWAEARLRLFEARTAYRDKDPQAAAAALGLARKALESGRAAFQRLRAQANWRPWAGGVRYARGEARLQQDLAGPGGRQAGWGAPSQGGEE